jgi:hypothetical protein
MVATTSIRPERFRRAGVPPALSLARGQEAGGTPALPGYSGLAPEALATLPHFSISAVM